MVDTEATVSLVTKKWCETHELDFTPVKNHPVVQAANGQPLNVVWTTSFTIRFFPSLEMDLEGVTVHDVRELCGTDGDGLAEWAEGSLGARLDCPCLAR